MAGSGVSCRSMVNPDRQQSALTGPSDLTDERRLIAGLSQRGVRVGRRKPVIQSNPTSEILTGSPTAGDGRVREVTNGSFGAAKLVESLGT